MSEKTAKPVAGPIVDAASAYVSDFLRTDLPRNYFYHNLEHTQSVVDAAAEIGMASGLTPDEHEIVALAAWFHDSGYVRGGNEHEEASCQIAREFLQRGDYPEERIVEVEKLIRATKYPVSPQSLPQEVLCDADMHHIGKKSYVKRADLLRTEWEFNGQVYSEVEWTQKNIEFLLEHRFYTEYARNSFREQKDATIARLQKDLRKLRKKSKETDVKIAVQKKKLESIESKASIPERGIETMFRVTLRNHINLSAIADNKANMMISVNAIIISIVVSMLVRKLDSNPHLIVPTILLLCVCVLTIIFATISTRPQVTEGTFTQEDVKQKKVNLLFFGNFYNMGLDDFMWGMKEMMKDRDYLYGSMTKDLFFLGRVLGRKYKFLRICYDVFMYGLIATILAFAIAVIVTPEPTTINDVINDL